MIGHRRAAFTLFELILAIALSAVLLALIGTAINLYLTRVAMSRDRVEEAQLARSILSMIAEDLRATAVYQPQDVSDVAQIMAQSASFDVDSIDDARSGGSGSASSSGSSAADSSSGGGGSGLSLSGSSSGANTSGSSSASSGGSSSLENNNYESEMPLGVNGAIDDLYIDIERLPRGDELFSTMTGYSNAPMAVSAEGPQTASSASWGMSSTPSDLKTVRYFLREGDRTEASGLAATSLEGGLQAAAGGLVRQEIPRQARLFAEQNANSAVLESGQVLVAPEVVHIEFRYFDGEQVYEVWDMVEQRSLPLAIEVNIWLTTAHEAAASAAAYDTQALLAIARNYRQTVFLPMAELSQNGAAGGMGGSSSGSSSSGSPTSSSSSTGSSTFGSSSSGSSSSGSSSSFGSSNRN
jgi:type II secretory pathway pseudopilin PulG